MKAGEEPADYVDSNKDSTGQGPRQWAVIVP